MSDKSDLLEQLNRAFGSRTGDRPRFTAEAEGDDYLFGRLPAVEVRSTDTTNQEGESNA